MAICLTRVRQFEMIWKWLVVSHTFIFIFRLQSNLTNIFQLQWTHQVVFEVWISEMHALHAFLNPKSCLVWDNPSAISGFRWISEAGGDPTCADLPACLPNVYMIWYALSNQKRGQQGKNSLLKTSIDAYYSWLRNSGHNLIQLTCFSYIAKHFPCTFCL